MLTLNHIHLRGTNPRKTAAWYVNMLGATIVRETETPAGVSLTLDIAGTRLNVASQPPGQHLPKGSAEVHLGLEHFGLQTDDLEGLLALLQPKGLEILEPLRALPTGMKIVFVRAPDDVRIELMQMPPA
ncbi:MAG: VOC family protein [Dehalococcoidia bacterium]|nr:VOC family protein [Dehalococcoidia bacterium]